MSQAVQNMFDRIAGRYDFLNHFLSMRRDIAWRRRACRYAGPAKNYLDLCGGTGDFSLTHLQIWGASSQTYIGDFSLGMLRVAQAKAPQIPCVQLDALRLPFADHSLDLITCGFGMRNLDQLDAGLRECHRSLRSRGRLVVLEFLRPVSWWPRFFYGVLAPLFIPVAGALLSGRREAYEYLVESVKRFVSPAEFCRLAELVGYRVERCEALDGGIAYLLVFEKVS